MVVFLPIVLIFGKWYIMRCARKKGIEIVSKNAKGMYVELKTKMEERKMEKEGVLRDVDGRSGGAGIHKKKRRKLVSKKNKKIGKVNGVGKPKGKIGKVGGGNMEGKVLAKKMAVIV